MARMSVWASRRAVAATAARTGPSRARTAAGARDSPATSASLEACPKASPRLARDHYVVRTEHVQAWRALHDRLHELHQSQQRRGREVWHKPRAPGVYVTHPRRAQIVDDLLLRHQALFAGVLGNA